MAMGVGLGVIRVLFGGWALFCVVRGDGVPVVTRGLLVTGDGVACVLRAS